MNRLLESHARLLASAFNDYGTFDFNKEVAEKVVKEHPEQFKNLKIEDLFKDENLSLLINAGIETLPTFPVFEIQGNALVLKSNRFFEIIRFSLAVSSFVKGVDQFISGEKLSEKKQRQFTVFAYYSSIFHLLTSFLTLHGTVYIPLSTEGVALQNVETTRKENKTVREITKISPIGFDKFRKGLFLQRKGEWSFSNSGNDHITRWKEFCDLLKKYVRNNWESQIPEGVVKFWGYMKVLNEYTEKRWDLRKKEYSIVFSNREEFLNVLNECQSLPAKIRHQKIYEDRHFDIFGLNYVFKNLSPPEGIADAEEKYFHRCAQDMLMWQYTNLKELFEKVRKNCKEESYFIKGMNAISANPFVKTLEYLLPFLMSDKKLVSMSKNLPEFLRMLLI